MVYRLFHELAVLAVLAALVMFAVYRLFHELAVLAGVLDHLYGVPAPS